MIVISLLYGFMHNGTINRKEISYFTDRIDSDRKREKILRHFFMGRDGTAFTGSVQYEEEHGGQPPVACFYCPIQHVFQR